MPATSLGVLFKETALKYPSKQAFLFKDAGRYEGISYQESLHKVNSLASAFLSFGLKTGDRLAILSENRPEWAWVDLASHGLGLVVVPIYTSLTSPEIQHILQDSGARILVVSSKALFEKIPPIQKSCEALERVVAMDGAVLIKQSDLSIPVHRLSDLEKTPLDPKVAETLSSLSSEALASIIYTSGTTGSPKGVMLTHGNFIENVTMCHEAFQMSPKDLHLSFLPLCHVLERTVGYYLMIYIGATIAYAENMDSVPQNMLEVRPTFLLGVPRFYEKIQTRVKTAVDSASGLRKRLFLSAAVLGQKRRLGQRLSLGESLRFLAVQKLVFSAFKKRLGGRVRFCVSGGAALSKEIAEFFHNLGVMICEGYGLTETSPVICANRVDRFKFGSVGFALKGVEVKISDEGEILTKSACVMQGYYRRSQETAQSIREGWFYTGDLGRIDSDGFIYITGRKKDILVTSGGKKVSPAPIEEALEKDPFILRAVLCGEGRKYITALLVPDKDRILHYASENKIAYTDYAALLNTKQIYQCLEERVQKVMVHLASYECVKYFALLENDFSIAAGELTPTLKIKRPVIFERYADRIAALYSPDKHA